MSVLETLGWIALFWFALLTVIGVGWGVLVTYRNHLQDRWNNGLEAALDEAFAEGFEQGMQECQRGHQPRHGTERPLRLAKNVSGGVYDQSAPAWRPSNITTGDTSNVYAVVSQGRQMWR